MKTFTLGLAALATLASVTAPVAASAQYYGGDRYDHAYRQAYRDGYNQGPRYYDRGDYRYRGNYRRCNDGTTGTIVGAIAGGLLGRTIDSRGDRTLGTLLGGGAGALAGRAIERDGRGGCR
jgi:uncharacterized protein YcfJ